MSKYFNLVYQFLAILNTEYYEIGVWTECNRGLHSRGVGMRGAGALSSPSLPLTDEHPPRPPPPPEVGADSRAQRVDRSRQI